MILLQGKGVSKGVTSGPLYFFRRSDATVTIAAEGPAEDEAIEAVRKFLEENL